MTNTNQQPDPAAHLSGDLAAKIERGTANPQDALRTVFICQHGVNMCIECAVTMNSVTAETAKLSAQLDATRAALGKIADAYNRANDLHLQQVQTHRPTGQQVHSCEMCERLNDIYVEIHKAILSDDKAGE